VATALVHSGVPAVLALQRPLSDSGAIAFSKAFYQRIAAGEAIDVALVEARLAIHRLDEESCEWATPVLFMGCPDGSLFRSLRWGLAKSIQRLLGGGRALLP
jgi:CHAT domain